MTPSCCAQSFKGATVFAERIADLGFSTPKPVGSLRTNAHLFPSSASRCGVYLLEFPEGKFYIGQAVDAVRRFADHRRNYENIIGFSFIPVPRLHLDDVEVALIHKADTLGIVLLNTTHASNVVGETDLDFLVSPDQQAAWLAEPEIFNMSEHFDPIVLPESQVQRCAARFPKLMRHPLGPTAFELLRDYIVGCVPSPRRTEYSFWAVSCLPATGRQAGACRGRCLACINMAFMETFVVCQLKGAPRSLWGYVNVASDVLFETFETLWDFADAFPSVEMLNHNYKDAGEHQVSLNAGDEAGLRNLMQNVAVRRAAGALALRVMRKRATVFQKHHCKPLADALLAPTYDLRSDSYPR